MTVTAGALTQVSVGATTAVLSSAAATAGVGPYTYQWYRSTVSGFTPGGGNIISGATSLSLSDSGLIPNTVYYYKVVATDTGNSNVTDDSDQLAVTTAGNALSQNQFAQAAIVGTLDLKLNYNTIPCQIDSTQATALYAGSAVKVVDSAGGVPKLIGCDANSDDCFGFINYDVKTKAFLAGAACEISQDGNVMYLYGTAAIARGAPVQLDVSGPGQVTALVGSSGADLVGWAFDKCAAYGSLFRVRLTVKGGPKSLKA